MGKYNAHGHPDGDDPHTITLTHDEVLILTDFLNRLERTEGLRFLHPGEYLALAHLAGKLEKIPWELFDPNYPRLVEEAQRRLSKGFEGSVVGLGEVAVDEDGMVVSVAQRENG